MGNSSNISIHFQLQKEAITVKGAKKEATTVKMLTWNIRTVITCVVLFIRDNRII